jgi:hypothetical protein
LLKTVQAPDEWQDVAFFRGTGSSDKNWLAAVTKRYKVVYSPKDGPWLFDLQDDPDELMNYYQNPAYKDVLRYLAQALHRYSRRDTRCSSRIQNPGSKWLRNSKHNKGYDACFCGIFQLPFNPYLRMGHCNAHHVDSGVYLG